MLSKPVWGSVRMQRASIKLVVVPAYLSVAVLSACSQLPSAGPSYQQQDRIS